MNFKSSNKVNPSFSMSTLTDIVFLLLMFFMMTSTSVKGLNILLPKGNGTPVNVKNISVSIDKDGIYYVDGKETPESDIANAIDAAAKQISNPVIILRAEKNTNMQKAVTIMDIANRYNYKLVLAVKPN